MLLASWLGAPKKSIEWSSLLSLLFVNATFVDAPDRSSIRWRKKGFGFPQQMIGVSGTQSNDLHTKVGS